MLKELGFTRTAGLASMVNKARMVIGGKILPKAVVTLPVKKPKYFKGLATGIGVGTVGTMGMGALFGKKRNSPYYP